MVKKITLSVMILFLLYSVVSIVLGYFNPMGSADSLGTHSYYQAMLKDSSNWKILFSNIFFALIPLSYLVFKKDKKVLPFMGLIFFALSLYSIVSMSIKGDFLGGGLIMVFINTFIIFFVMCYFMIGMLSFGTWLKSKFLKIETKTIFDIFMNLGIGLSVFLILNYILVVTSLFFSIISWIMFLGIAYFIYTQKKSLGEMQTIVMKTFDGFGSIVSKPTPNVVFSLLLLLFCFVYFNYGFTSAYIPYPTAWDANHAYMFLPKIWAYSHGFDWSGRSLLDIGSLWSAYLGFWFNLFWPMEKSFWITPDTFAIELNFLSGPLVLFFSLALFKEILDSISKIVLFITKKEENHDGEKIKPLIFNMGWFFTLLWLTSGMGAFLVFVDNKTDLGVMSLIVLAIYSGFVALKRIFESENQQAKSIADYYDVLISGFFFAVAIMSKPTSFLDAFNFGLLLFWIFIGTIGSLGIFLLIIGGLAFAKFRGISDYMGSSTGGILAIPGVLGFAYDFVRSFMNKKKIYLKYIIVWTLTMFATFIVVKGVFLFAYQIVIQKGFSPKNYIQSLLFGSTSSNRVYADEITGAVDTGATSVSTGATEEALSGVQDSNPVCSMDSLGISDSSKLYTDLKTVEDTSYQEDVGRYVGYGARSFVGPWWGFIFPGDNACYGFDSSAILLCENSSLFADVSKLNLAKIKEVMDKMPTDSKGYSLLDAMFKKIDYKTDIQLTEDVQSKITSDVTDIQTFTTENTIATSIVKSTSSAAFAKSISIPYKYLVYFNITFNWSLQNQSSYYTDIGFVWLLLLIINFIGLVYSIIKKNKFLMMIEGVSAFAWIIWFFIGGGILWYGMGIIIWTILAFMVFLYYLFSSKDEVEQGLFNTFVVILIIFGSWQLLLNFIRISTQGAAGPFSWYKQSFGQEQKINMGEGTIDMKAVEVFPYKADKLFNMQFAHYNKFLDIVNNRPDGEGMLLAGTYARYFIKNQTNIVYDQFLTQLYGRINDNDPCKSYLRLKDKKIKYITIDPNIGTVVMGGGNSSLFDRFFAKFNSVTGKVESYGAFLMLGEMYSRGYLNYISSNNLAIKYAFSLPNEDIEKFMGGKLTYQDLGLFRAKLALIRFWGETEREMYLSFLVNTIKTRMMSFDFVGDLADMQGKTIDETKLKSVLKDYLVNNKSIKDLISSMTDDEQYILYYYLSFYQTMQNDSQGFSQSIMGLLSQNISSGSQIMSLEVK